MTYTQEELDAECKRHFQMGVEAAKIGRTAELIEKRARFAEGNLSSLWKKVSNFEDATGCKIELFRDKSTIDLLKRLLEIRGDSKKIKQLIEVEEAIRAASDMIGQEMSTLLNMPGVSIPDDEWYDY